MTIAGEVGSVSVQKCARSSPSGNLIHRSCLPLLYPEIEQLGTLSKPVHHTYRSRFAHAPDRASGSGRSLWRGAGGRPTTVMVAAVGALDTLTTLTGISASCRRTSSRS